MKKMLIAIFTLYLLFSLNLCSIYYAQTLAHLTPNYPREDLTFLLEKSVEEYTADDFDFIFKQTGVGKSGVLSLSDKNMLLQFQDNFFSEVEILRKQTSIITFEEQLLSEKAKLVPLEEGDILVTFSAYFMSWRNGHAAIVVDENERKTLEAVVIGANSKLQNADKWAKYPSFMVLRLKDATKEKRAEIAKTATEYLTDRPYSLFARKLYFDFSDTEEITGTHCAHLVWLAYANYGYDIDSDGGFIVTPKDISESDLFEIVQVYG